MNRYIRTKDGIYELQKTKSGEKYLVKPNKLIPKWNTEAYEDIRQADTIEELCDRFVYVTNKGNHYVKDEHNATQLFFDDEKPIAYYGAIWTDEGLIYVAKMNEKGDLELL